MTFQELEACAVEVRQRVGKRIRETRLAKGLTMRQVADACGLSRGTIYFLETAHHSPALDSVWMVSQILELPMGSLVR